MFGWGRSLAGLRAEEASDAAVSVAPASAACVGKGRRTRARRFWMRLGVAALK